MVLTCMWTTPSGDSLFNDNPLAHSMPGAGVVHHIIFDRRCGFPLPFDVCSSPKATYLLRDNEMTRKVQAGLPLQGFGDGPDSRPPNIVCHRASLYKAGATGTFPSAWLREVAAPAGKNGLALGKAEEL